MTLNTLEYLYNITKKFFYTMIYYTNKENNVVGEVSSISRERNKLNLKKTIKLDLKFENKTKVRSESGWLEFESQFSLNSFASNMNQV